MERAVTFKDLESIPEGKNGEIVDGELFVSSRPAPRFTLAATMIMGGLFGPFSRSKNGPGGWWIQHEPEIHLGDDALIPNCAGWRRDRVPQLPEAVFTTAPDWICEVVSPATARLDLVKKLPKYALYGVQHAWIVCPLHRILWVYRRAEPLWTLVAVHDGDDKVRAEPFDAIEFDLGALWDTGAPPP